jgi:hypothetical protein
MTHVLAPSTEASDDEITPESRIKKNRQSVAGLIELFLTLCIDMKSIIQSQENLLSKLDSTTHQLTLEALEQENVKLMLNPKTILASEGSYQTTSTTLQSFNAPCSILRTEETDNADVEFWNGIMSDYSSLVHKIPQVLIKRIRGGIPSDLRVCFDSSL